MCQCPVHRPDDIPVIRDIADQPLAIGDRVATLTPRYRYKLSLGRVVKFTPKGLKVRLDNPRWAGDDHLVQLDVAPGGQGAGSMTEYHRAVGADDVLRASHNMSRAADEMQRAAINFCGAIEHMGRLVDRMEAAAQAMTEALEKGADLVPRP